MVAKGPRSKAKRKNKKGTPQQYTRKPQARTKTKKKKKHVQDHVSSLRFMGRVLPPHLPRFLPPVLPLPPFLYYL